MSRFRLLPSHRGCEKIITPIDDKIAQVMNGPFGNLVRLYMKSGLEVDIFPTGDGKYTVAKWTGNLRTVIQEGIAKDDVTSLKKIFDT